MNQQGQVEHSNHHYLSWPGGQFWQNLAMAAPWGGRFFADLEAATAAALYQPIGTLGRVFMEIETTAFDMAA
jgi:hypothetical protein